jgi:hypothetical protein
LAKRSDYEFLEHLPFCPLPETILSPRPPPGTAGRACSFPNTPRSPTSRPWRWARGSLSATWL